MQVRGGVSHSKLRWVEISRLAVHRLVFGEHRMVLVNLILGNYRLMQLGLSCEHMGDSVLYSLHVCAPILM